MAFWVYILRCGDDRFYTGQTDDLDLRVAQHMVGRGSEYAARRQPVKLAWADSFATRVQALEFERQVKGWSRAKKEALIARDWAALQRLAASSGTGPSTGSGSTHLKQGNAVRAELDEARATNTSPTP